MKKIAKDFKLSESLIINEGWVSMPLNVAKNIAMESFNNGYINMWQHHELDKEVFENCITDEDGGNAGKVPVIDACEFLKKLAIFSNSEQWGE